MWRVENREGAGPYRSAQYGGHLAELSQLGFNEPNDPKRPDPSKDSTIARYFNGLNITQRSKLIYGFRSLAQYRSWFNQKAVRDFLSDKGYFLTQYQVKTSNAVFGNAQAAFLVKDAFMTAFRRCDTSLIEASEVKHLPEPIRHMVRFRQESRHLALR